MQASYKKCFLNLSRKFSLKSVTLADPGDTMTFSVYLAVDDNETCNHGNWTQQRWRQL